MNGFKALQQRESTNMHELKRWSQASEDTGLKTGELFRSTTLDSSAFILLPDPGKDLSNLKISREKRINNHYELC